jgi:hypothetical protein
MNFYCCCKNFYKVKILIDQILRYCAIKTIATKHKMTVQETIKKWSRNLIINDKTKRYVLTQYPTKTSILNYKKKYITDLNFIEF